MKTDAYATRAPPRRVSSTRPRCARRRARRAPRLRRSGARSALAGAVPRTDAGAGATRERRPRALEERAPPRNAGEERAAGVHRHNLRGARRRSRAQPARTLAAGAAAWALPTPRTLLRGLSSRRTPGGAKRPRAPACRAAGSPGPRPGEPAPVSRRERGATGTPAPALRPKGDARGARRGRRAAESTPPSGRRGPARFLRGAFAPPRVVGVARVRARRMLLRVFHVLVLARQNEADARARRQQARPRVLGERRGAPAAAVAARGRGPPRRRRTCVAFLSRISRSSPFKAQPSKRGGAKNGLRRRRRPLAGAGCPPQRPGRSASPRPARNSNEAASARRRSAAAPPAVSTISAGVAVPVSSPSASARVPPP